MPKKPAAAPADENTAQAIDPQKQYLMDQFGDLMEQVGDGFGGPLQEELIRRLEQTIADFHEEVNEMLGNLKENSEKRHNRLKEIWNNPEASSATETSEASADPEPTSDDSEMSEWEKKLESGGDEVGDDKPEKEEPKKKKGFFGRKKK